ncbi:MAG: hypothetical protein FWG18_01435 [Alphaproteobacteria bacterium]|nr:hypothetical protein [Alphaproteobacteria bacterium]
MRKMLIIICCLLIAPAFADDSKTDLAGRIAQGRNLDSNPEACETLKQILLKRLDEFPEMSINAMDHVQRADIYNRLAKNDCVDDSGVNYAELEKKELSIAAALDDVNTESYKRYYDQVKSKLHKHGVPVIMDILDWTDSVEAALEKR